jgi:YVTN family beta-propeller protein
MKLGQTRARLVLTGAVLGAGALIAGCGSAYRSVVTPITSSGPAAQSSSYAAVISSTSTSASGVATIIDYSGDSVLASQTIGVGPVAFSISSSGSYGYTINSDETMTTFPISSSFQEKQVYYSTLSSSASPVNLYYPSSGLWATDLSGNVADVFTGTSGSALALEGSVSVATTPVAVAGPATIGQRTYVVSQGSGATSGVYCNNTSNFSAASDGYVTPVEVSSYTADSAIEVGKCPVYALTNSDGTRLFVLNRGSDTISVINTSTNASDSCSSFTNQSGQTVTCHPTLPLSTAALTSSNVPANCDTSTDVTCGLPTSAGPVYAEYNKALQELIVADYDGGYITIIDVSMDEYGNDSTTFGTTYSVQVGNHPASVTALYDGSRAYAANQTDETVSIVNLSSHSVTKTLSVVGHPRNVASTQNTSTYGKVYVASPDSEYLTIINTKTDEVDTTVLVSGNVIDVRVSSQSADSTDSTAKGNSNVMSRRPGYGQPCNLSPELMESTYGSSYTLANCTAVP